MENNGWIKLHRKMLDNVELFGKTYDFAIFTYLILKADRNTGVAKIGRLDLAKKFRSDESTIYKTLKRLESEGFIRIEGNNHCSEVFVLKYAIYQNINYELSNEKESNNKVTTNGEKSNTQSNTQSNNQKPEVEEVKSNNESNNESNSKVTTRGEESNTIQEYKKKNIKNNTNIFIPPDLKEEDLQYIADKYKVSFAFVNNKYDDLLIWIESNPSNPKLRGRDWKKTLMGFVKKDLAKYFERSQNGKHSIDAREL